MSDSKVVFIVEHRPDEGGADAKTVAHVASTAENALKWCQDIQARRAGGWYKKLGHFAITGDFIDSEDGYGILYEVAYDGFVTRYTDLKGRPIEGQPEHQAKPV